MQCKKCNAFYIGETGQMLSKLVNGHRSTWVFKLPNDIKQSYIIWCHHNKRPPTTNSTLQHSVPGSPEDANIRQNNNPAIYQLWVVKCKYKLVITLYISLLRNNKMDNSLRFHKYNIPERHHYYFKRKILNEWVPTEALQ